MLTKCKKIQKIFEIDNLIQPTKYVKLALLCIPNISGSSLAGRSFTYS